MCLAWAMQALVAGAWVGVGGRGVGGWAWVAGAWVGLGAGGRCGCG